MDRLTPKQVIQGTKAEYGIVWNSSSKDSIVVPHEVYGNHSFLNISKLWKFSIGEGCVGRAYARHETIVIEDMMTANSSSNFLRSGAAEQCGIRTIAFVPQADGSVLEVGFQLTLEQLPNSWWMENLLDMCTERASGTSRTLHRLRTPSPECFLNCRMMGANVHETGYEVMMRPSSQPRSLSSTPALQTVVMVVGVPILDEDGASSPSRMSVTVSCGRQFDDSGSSTQSMSVEDLGEVICSPSQSDIDGESYLSSLPASSRGLPSNVLGSSSKADDDVIDSTSQSDTDGESHGSSFPASSRGLPSNVLSLSLADNIPLPNPCESIDGFEAAASDDWINDEDPFLSLQMTRAPAYVPCSYLPEAEFPWTPSMSLPLPPSTITPPCDASCDVNYEWVCSAGSIGHPFTCGGACKYNKTAKGCKLGASCNRCHLCHWTRASERALNTFKQCSSVGSIGHPLSCAGACRFNTQKVCKEGSNCNRCHLCHWTRAGERALSYQKICRT